MECTLRHGCRALALAALVLGPAVASAADNGFYLGAAASNGSSDYGTPGGTGSADDDNGFKLIGGFRPLDAFAIEANYVDLGTARTPLSIACITTPCPTVQNTDARALSVSAV